MHQAKISQERMIVAAFNTGPVVDLAVTKEPAAKKHPDPRRGRFPWGQPLPHADVCLPGAVPGAGPGFQVLRASRYQKYKKSAISYHSMKKTA